MKIISIGRAPENDIVLSDPKVSARHASITCTEEGKYLLRDLYSSNGTYVNGHKTGQVPLLLQVTDNVQIGDTKLPWQSYFQADIPTTAVESQPVIPRDVFSEPISFYKKYRVILIIFFILLLCLGSLFLLWYFTQVVKPELARIPFSIHMLLKSFA